MTACAWILESLKSGDHNGGDDHYTEKETECDELHLAERLSEFWETSDLFRMSRVLLRFVKKN